MKEAISAFEQKRHPFITQHQVCVNIIAIPTEGRSHIMLRCTSCPYIYRLITSETPTSIDQQSLIITRSLQPGIRKAVNTHYRGCMRPNCKTFIPISGSITLDRASRIGSTSSGCVSWISQVTIFRFSVFSLIFIPFVFSPLNSAFRIWGRCPLG